MKAKELVIDLEDSLPKFVEKTLDVSTTQIENKSPLKNSNILKDLEKQENISKIRENVEIIENKEEEVKNNEEEVKKTEEDCFQELKSALVPEEKVCETSEMKDNKKESKWKEEMMDKVKINLEFFFEYFMGFVIGVSMSLLGYRFVNYVNKKRRTRKGLFMGCMVSFVLIFFLCIFYMTYTRDVLLTERSWSKHHRSLKKLQIPGFSMYLRYNISNISHGIGSALSSLLPRFSYSRRRHHRSALRTRHKIRALKHMRNRIHRHLRVLL